MGTTAGKNVGDGTYRRKAYHAGSWYEDDKQALGQTLQGYLDAAASEISNSSSHNNVRAVIAPHAGYRYSGPTAAYGYLQLERALNSSTDHPCEHILVLHPAHHVYLQGCAVSGASELETPLGNLPVDDELRKEILALSSKFTVMDASTDNEEHSGEMQYPYLAKILLSMKQPPSVLPIMCGALSTFQEELFGNLLAPIIARPNVVCVISSDFCHWGSRFRYQPISKDGSIPIHQFIQEMDHRGMDLIAMKEPGAFAEYLKKTKNTICGRHAIAVWLQAIASKDHSGLTVNFVKYAQSSAVKTMQDSSVSYASAVVMASTA
ncbi:MEMO1 family protein C4H3.04c [Seminavis robusta]|uniref:MEMO1 family protein C4H3.04c n=1 Tax=Seminavis robusta TaxID=568900 RepID=A0A9N8E639_9STRA|nr:MEMO1 family protein C4H3.04c [Seminavis robusta]|eukprot:Sro588_g171570.1 MEMO1 family protein C4H3.04c (321) ;mRNA; r:46843-47805